MKECSPAPLSPPRHARTCDGDTRGRKRHGEREGSALRHAPLRKTDGRGRRVSSVCCYGRTRRAQESYLSHISDSRGDSWHRVAQTERERERGRERRKAWHRTRQSMYKGPLSPTASRATWPLRGLARHISRYTEKQERLYSQFVGQRKCV